MKDAKSYDPNIDKAGFEDVFIGKRVEQVKNGGAGSGNFGHSGRPGEVGGSGGGGGSPPAKGGSSKIRVSIPDNEGGATIHELEGYRREPRVSEKGSGLSKSESYGFSTKYSDVGVSPKDMGDYERRQEGILVRAKEAGLKAHPDSRAAERHAAEAADAVNSSKKGGTGGTVYGSHISTPDQKNIPMVAYGAGTTKTQIGRIEGRLRDANFNVVHDPERQGFLVTSRYAKPEFWTGKQDTVDTMQPGTAFVPQGNKTEMVTNPPYQTPELGDAPEEMKKEADRIYKALRKEQFHEETPADRESAARVMWTTLEKNWKKDKDGKWVKKEKSE